MRTMLGKSVIGVFIFLNIHFLSYVEGEGDFFKVPLEVREKNRPKRLVDDVNDPDMMKLRSLQDRFFSIVGNSSLGQEFKSLNQLLHLIDSEAGIELGRLFLNGIMIGFSKKQSNQLLSEFFDDFQYRVSPDLADALVNYRDFIKIIDFKMIALTLEMLFKKDTMGNSLAQMPMGQLVDLIQPEASKYGIDARSFINGIIGKGGSNFPDMVRKMMYNFNATTIMKSLTTSFIQEIVDTAPPKKYEEDVVDKKKLFRDQPLMIFKPLVAKFLKRNEIDLEAGAVIQVLTPFLKSWTQSLKDFIQSLQKNDFDFAQLLPLLGLFSSLTNTNNKNSQGDGREGRILEAVMDVVDAVRNIPVPKNNQNMDAILSLASQFVNNNKPAKNGKVKSEANTNEEAGIDMASLMLIAQSFMGNSGNGGDILSGLANQMMEGSSDTLKIMEMVSSLIGGIAKAKNDISSQATATKTGKLNSEIPKSKSFPEALEQFLLRLQIDEKSHTKVKDVLAFLKHMLAIEVKDMDLLKKQFVTALQPHQENIEKDIEALFIPFSYSEEQWNLLWKELADTKVNENIVLNTIEPLTDIILLLVSDQFQNKQNTLLRKKTQEIFSHFGIQGVSINNFPERLRPLVNMASKGWSLPVNVDTLLEPLKNSLKETWAWYRENVERLKPLQKKKVESIVAQSLKHDVVKPLTAISKISEASKSSPDCVSRAVCQLVRDVPPGQALRLFITQLASISYGGFRANNEDNFLLFIQVSRAAVFKGDCEKYFPIQCPEDYHSTDDDTDTDDEEDDDPTNDELDDPTNDEQDDFHQEL